MCNYRYIVYPAAIDEVVFDGQGGYDKSYRYEVEVLNAARYFAETVGKITGDTPSVVSQTDYESGNAVMLVLADAPGVEKEGFAIEVSDSLIRIVSPQLRGLCNGLYGMLEDDFGCMFVTPEYDYIPGMSTVYLNEGTRVENPSVEWRYVYAYEADYREKEGGDSEYIGWHNKLRLNGAGTNDWYKWVHTSFYYLPPEEYYDEHPEYYGLYMGKRTYKQGPVSGQLCWTNEEVYQIISGKVLQEMRDNPDLHVWDVSQMDTWESRGVGCQCDDCKALDEREGTPMGSLLTFINRLADDMAREFPDNYISTLAYNYTAEAPAQLRPRDNVIIKLCLMPGDCASSYADPDSKAGRKAHDLVESWGKVAKHLAIWDYNIDFFNYLMPYPILDSLQANNDFYVENNTYGMFHQMSADKGGDFAEINSYIMARLMWNKDVDVQSLFNKYLTVRYGAAAEHIARYYDALATNVEKSGKDMYIYSSVENNRSGYLSPVAIDEYIDIFEDAEAAVADDARALEAVQKAKTGVMFAKAEQFSADMKGRRSALEETVSLCNKFGITSLIEGDNGNELQTFYDRNLAEIKAIPAIVIAMILACALTEGVIAAVVCIIRYRIVKGEWPKIRSGKSSAAN